MESKVSYSPRPSLGWLSLCLPGIFILTATLLPMLMVQDFEISFVSMLAPTIGTILAVVFFMLACLFPTISYELRQEELALLFGSKVLYRIPFAEIQSIAWQDLSISLTSSFRLPGVALFSVPYNNTGSVKMCATSAANHILLIRTSKAVYGITPADEKAFTAALLGRVKVSGAA